MKEKLSLPKAAGLALLCTGLVYGLIEMDREKKYGMDHRKHPERITLADKEQAHHALTRQRAALVDCILDGQNQPPNTSPFIHKETGGRYYFDGNIMNVKYYEGCFAEAAGNVICAKQDFVNNVISQTLSLHTSGTIQMPLNSAPPLPDAMVTDTLASCVAAKY